MTLSPQAQHDVIIQYLKEIHQTTKVFECNNVKWKKGMLLSSTLLQCTPITTYKKYGWSNKQIKTLFARIGHKPNSIKKKRKTNKRIKSKFQSDGNINILNKRKIPRALSAETSSQTKKKANGLQQSKVCDTHESKYDAANPYLDASVFSNGTKESNSQSHPSTDVFHDKLSPSSAKQILEQIPWQNMKEYGIMMECNFVFRRDKDAIIDQLKQENKRLMERLKSFEHEPKKENQHKNQPEIKYEFDGFNDAIVILRSECINKPLVEHYGALKTAKQFIGFEVFSKWRLIKNKHENGIYKLQVHKQSAEEDKFICAFRSKSDSKLIEVAVNNDSSSACCEFKAHLLPNRNVVMFESVLYPNKYLAVNKNGTVYIHYDDDNVSYQEACAEECLFQVLIETHNITLHIKKKDEIVLIANVDINDCVATVKHMIEEKEKIAINEQRLYLKEVELNDNHSLNRYILRGSDVVQLTLELDKNIEEEKDINMDENSSSSDDYNKESDELEATSSSAAESEYCSSDDSTENSDTKHESKEDHVHDDDDDVKEAPKTQQQLTRQTSVFKSTLNDKDIHHGGISSICVSPIDYTVVTGGDHDSSLRIWQPKQVQKQDGKLLSEIQFIPTQKANVNGTVFSVNVSDDGVLIAAGCSWRKSENGYVVIWNMKQKGRILCDLKSKDEFSVESRKKRTRHSRSLSVGLETVNLKQISKSNIFKIKQTDAVSSLRFGIVHCVKIMKFRSKHKHRLNYLLFAGDTTGCVLCWNLSLKHNKEIPICRINAGNDVIYDLEIKQNKYLFVVSQDKTMRYCNINGFEKKKASYDEHAFESIDTMQIYKDQEYPLLSIALNCDDNELIFGSRKCVQFEMNQMVVIQHKFNKYLCLDDKRQISGNGTEIKHKSHKWNIEYLPKERIRLRSRKSGKYLRIKQNGTIDAEGSGIQTEFESILIWRTNEKTLQSHKYRHYFIGIAAENNAVVCVNKDGNINDKISVEFDLFDADKLQPFQSFFKCINEPSHDLDRVKSLKIRNKLLIVQRKGKKNQIKLFNLDANKLIKTYKITQCQYQDDDNDKIRNCHIFRVYDSGISFNAKYVILCVGIFESSNLKKAVAFSLKGFKIAKSNKKLKMCSFCPLI